MKNNITIFLNVHKKENEKTPDYRGYIDIDGEKYEVSLWVNTNIKEIPIHMSGQVTPAEEE